MLQTLGTFLLVDFSWIFFDGSLYECGLNRANFWLMLFSLCILWFADYCKVKGIQIRQMIIRQDYWFRWIFVSLSICGILTFGMWGAAYDAADFIYFQF